MMRLKPSGKKREHVLGCLKRKHRVAGKISLGGNNRELWNKKNQV